MAVAGERGACWPCGAVHSDVGSADGFCACPIPVTYLSQDPPPGRLPLGGDHRLCGWSLPTKGQVKATHRRGRRHNVPERWSVWKTTQ